MHRMISVLVAATGATAVAGKPASSEPTAALTLVEEMNAWCRHQGDDCAMSEMPDAYPGRVAAGETNGWISDHRARLGKLGVTVVWDAGLAQFETQVESDLRLIIGGNFAADHLGPARYEEVTKRARARPAVYLGVLADRIVGAKPDQEWLSSTYVPAALALVAAPDAARPVAGRLLVVFRSALAVARDASRAERLRQRVRELEQLAK